MKTKEWLREQLKIKNITQKELADGTGISVNAISKIIRGERLGSPESWEKILNFLEYDGSIYSFDSEELIEEIKQDIEEFGEDEQCYLFYQIIDNNIIFDNYDFIVDEMPLTKEELKENYIITSLKNALEFLERQNEIL